MRRKLRLLACLAALLAPPALAAAAAPDDGAIRAMMAQRLAAMGQGGGMVVGVVDASGRRVISLGTLGRGDLRPMDGRTVFWLASVTKVFTALLLGQMAQAHELSVDDPAAAFLPGPADRLPRSGARAVSLADLATMTAGFPPKPDNLSSADKTTPFAGYRERALLSFAASAPRPTAEARTWAYSDVSYALLGVALAHHAGQAWGDLVRTRITGPLGMADTGLAPTPDMRARQATEYDRTGAVAPKPDYGAMESAGALYGTTDDLLTLLEALLGYRQPSQRAALDVMLATRRPGGQPPSGQAALGWSVWRDGAREIAWKDGLYHAFIGLDRASGLGVVVLTNGRAPGGANALGLRLLDPDFPMSPDRGGATMR